MQKYCWAGTAQDILAISVENWLRVIQKNYALMFPNKDTKIDPSDSQIRAWKDSFTVLKTCLNGSSKILESLTFIFEYFLPRENGRRPDVVVLSSDKVLILEFKMKGKALFVDIDQAADYKRDIYGYHEPSQNREVEAVLVLTEMRDHYSNSNHRNLLETSSDHLKKVLNGYFDNEIAIDQTNLEEWIHGSFRPLPTLINAAQRMFKDGEIPNIKNAKVDNFDNITSYLDDVIERTEKNKEKAIIFITGIPGAGKTYLGIKYAYELYKGDEQRSTFLSGNGPLVKVLQKALQSRALVRSQKSYIKDYNYGRSSKTYEKVIVLDEAQRLWDREYVSKKHGINISEPEILLNIAQNIDDWGVVIALIGTGQEIYLGEEGGMNLWHDAINKLENNWKIYAPNALFEDTLINSHFEAVLNLDISLRSHLAENVHLWVEAVLEGNALDANKLSTTFNSDYPIYILRDIKRARGYCKAKYKEADDKTFGLIASSKSIILPKFGVDNSYNGSKQISIEDWYLAPKGHKNSASSFNHLATEFSCQGLELDFPVVCWEKDLIFQENKWIVDPSARSKLKDYYQITKNVYRVLLTRGRDGMIIYIPDDRSMDSTYEYLVSCGGITIEGV